MKQTGMLVFSLRGVNFGFWSRLGCSGQSTNHKPPRSRLGFREETQNYELVSFRGHKKLEPRPDGLP